MMFGSPLDDADNRRRVLAALEDWCRLDLPDPGSLPGGFFRGREELIGNTASAA